MAKHFYYCHHWNFSAKPFAHREAMWAHVRASWSCSLTAIRHFGIIVQKYKAAYFALDVDGKILLSCHEKLYIISDKRFRVWSDHCALHENLVCNVCAKTMAPRQTALRCVDLTWRSAANVRTVAAPMNGRRSWVQFFSALWKLKSFTPARV